MLLDVNVATAPFLELKMCFPLVVKFDFMFADNLLGKFTLINKNKFVNFESNHIN